MEVLLVLLLATKHDRLTKENLMNSHLNTAHQYGVNKALEECGYKTAEEVVKEASELGLLEHPAQT